MSESDYAHVHCPLDLGRSTDDRLCRLRKLFELHEVFVDSEALKTFFMQFENLSNFYEKSFEFFQKAFGIVLKKPFNFFMSVDR